MQKGGVIPGSRLLGRLPFIFLAVSTIVIGETSGEEK